MNRTHFRGAAAVAIAALVAVALTGCINRPGDAATWLSGQSGVVSTEILQNNTGEFQSSGTIRGELDSELSDQRLADLVNAVQGYQQSHDQVVIQLGRDNVDFTVTDEKADNDSAVDLWRQVAEVPEVVEAVTSGGFIFAETLRTDAAAALEALHGFDADVTLQGYPDAAAIAAYAGFVQVDWSAGCTPAKPQLALAESFFDRDEVAGGALVLCQSFDPYYAEGASLATLVPPLYDELVAADLADFPVTIHQAVGPVPDGHLVTVTPGEPAALGVLAAFEAEGLPATLYELDGDRSLQVWQYDTPTDVLVGALTVSPSAAGLSGIRVEGSTYAVSGPIADLPALSAQAGALAAASDIFANVELSPTTGFLNMDSPVMTDPDVTVAARALRDSGAWQGRTFTVAYVHVSVTIVDGVATQDDFGTNDAHVTQDFITAWNATSVQ